MKPFRVLVAAVLLYGLLASFLPSPSLGVTSGVAASTPVLSDNFSDNVINHSFWTASQGGTGPTVSETNGEVEITIPANSSNDPVYGSFWGGYSSICQLRGDFDMQVDYGVINWPYSNGVSVNFNDL